MLTLNIEELSKTACVVDADDVLVTNEPEP